MKKRVKNKETEVFTKKQKKLLYISAIALGIFLIILIELLTTHQISKLDQIISENMISIQNPSLTNVMIFITNLGGPISIALLSILLCLFLISRKKYTKAIILIMGILIGSFLELTIKEIVQRTRPENALIKINEFSFPSGHAIISIVFFSLMIYSFKSYIKDKKLRIILAIPLIILTILIGFSRIYLNVHWFSDVIAGFALGISIVSILIFIIKYRFSKKNNQVKKGS
jgi:undecaprenyl-diphosphatase